ncbi:MAG: flagellar hook capping FlgD N-terminal domain-containing protein [Campylobacterota bacterium]|nr:flagellar hook capping FlgD N-terminal domain-containing protein [Campylobacterota bacterium]
MAITSTGLNADVYNDYQAPVAAEDKSVLGKDDFMTLLLVELQNQDPTEPMDSDKILTQTSQLAGLEASENTNQALSDLAASMGATQQFSTVSAIGKTADLGSNAVSFDEGSITSFEVYFPDEIASGDVEILDVDGNLVNTIAIEPNAAGVYQFDWDGSTETGGASDSGVYYITASYKNTADEELSTRMGAYPIESVRFEGGDTLVKVGSSYVSLSNVVEIY